MYAKIAKWLSWVLMIVSVVIVVFGFSKGFESNGGAPVDLLLRWGYVLLFVAVALVVILGIVLGAMNDPKSLIKLGIGLVAAAALALVAYALASGSPLVGYLGEQPDQQTLKLTDTILNLTYILAGGAIVSIIVGEVIGAARNK